MFQIRQATRTRRPLKINFEGLSGSGKTYTALRMAFDMRRHGIGSKLVVVDSENSSSELYAGLTEDGERWSFDVVDMPPDKRNPLSYTQAYEHLTAAGYDIIVCDSLTHAWHGALDQVEATAARQRKPDKFAAWASVTPVQRRMLETLTDRRAHLISTMRVKSEYERVEGDNGKTQIKKVGVKADQRADTEYEFDLVVRLDDEHRALVEKVRGCTAMDGQRTASAPGPAFWRPLLEWWKGGEPVPTVTPQPVTPRPAASEVDSFEQSLSAARTMAELHAAWQAIPAHQRPDFVSVKDRMKEAIRRCEAGVVHNGVMESA